jgi:hypothetical protein
MITTLPNGWLVSEIDINGISITRYFAPGTRPRPDARAAARRLGARFARLTGQTEIRTDEFGIEYETENSNPWAGVECTSVEQYDAAIERRQRRDAQRRTDAGLRPDSRLRECELRA